MQTSNSHVNRLIDHPHKLKGLVSRATLKSLHKVDTLRGILSIVTEWVLIAATAFMCESYFSWPLYIIAVIFIGARLLALGLIMHESVHYLISKNRKLNDAVAELFCAWPLFISMRSYRIKHLAHHKWLNTDKDPDYVAKIDDTWRFPMSFKKFIKIIFTQISGFGVFETFRVMSSKQMKINKPKTPLWYHLSRISFYVISISTFIYLGKGFLLLKYWIIPFATWTQFANRLRRIAEHSGIEDKPLAMQTRTTKHSYLMRLLLVPKNISYHCEHHLYPGIPCYHLPKIHKELLKHEVAKENFYISDNYRDVFRDCIKIHKRNSESA